MTNSERKIYNTLQGIEKRNFLNNTIRKQKQQEKKEKEEERIKAEKEKKRLEDEEEEYQIFNDF
jgi:hypothetical protein